MRELITKSLIFDFRLLMLGALPMSVRLSFLAQKWVALVKLLGAKKTSRIRVGQIDFKVTDVSGLGSLQSSIVDFYRDVVCLRALPSNPTVVDAGANVGQFCSAVKFFYPEATVYSFEPDPTSHAALLDNTRSMTNVTTYQMGLSNRAATIPFFKAELASMSSFIPHEGTTPSGDLEVDRLDSVLPHTKRIDLLKIDVEGLEYEVLEGSEALLGGVAWLIVEVSLGRSRDDRTNVDLMNLLSEKAPGVRLLKTGRPLGDLDQPACQDFVFDLRESTSADR